MKTEHAVLPEQPVAQGAEPRRHPGLERALWRPTQRALVLSLLPGPVSSPLTSPTRVSYAPGPTTEIRWRPASSAAPRSASTLSAALKPHRVPGSSRSWAKYASSLTNFACSSAAASTSCCRTCIPRGRGRRRSGSLLGAHSGSVPAGWPHGRAGPIVLRETRSCYRRRGPAFAEPRLSSLLAPVGP